MEAWQRLLGRTHLETALSSFEGIPQKEQRAIREIIALCLCSLKTTQKKRNDQFYQNPSESKEGRTDILGFKTSKER
jgi:hypothetical protein